MSAVRQRHPSVLEARVDEGDMSLNARGPVDCALQGQAILNSAFFNKGSAFPLDERSEFSIEGLLPAAVVTLGLYFHLPWWGWTGAIGGWG